MNRIIIIGNGFDLAHGLNTRYEDFINWYWDKRIDAFAGNITKISEDYLCRLRINDGVGFSCWNVFAFESSCFKDFRGNRKYSGYNIIKEMQNNTKTFSIDFTPFFRTILQSIETKGWVDIEHEYYQLLKLSITEPNKFGITPKALNEQLEYIRILLAEYLLSLDCSSVQPNSDICECIYEGINPNDISISSMQYYDDYCAELTDMEKEDFQSFMRQYDITSVTFSEIQEINQKHIHERPNRIKYNDEEKRILKLITKPKNVLLLSFNYTPLVRMYNKKDIGVSNYIHGELSNPGSIIFGYGDELDDDYRNILQSGNNEFLTNIKSIKYLETTKYREMLAFIESSPYQVYIMGHSCGNSDRTLLNTLFEHKNCVSIKPFYYKKEDGTDNYIEIVQNISRNFGDMKLMRDRVVKKVYCVPLSQAKSDSNKS